MEGVAYRIKDIFRGMVFVAIERDTNKTSIRTRFSKEGTKVYHRKSYELGRTKVLAVTGGSFSKVSSDVSTLIQSIPGSLEV